MNKFDLQEIAIDSLTWINASALLVVWGQVTQPLWSQLPPGVLILLALGLLVAIVHILKHFLREDSPPWMWIVRGVQMGIGLIVGIVGLLP